jgi:hypothetical protein
MLSAGLSLGDRTYSAAAVRAIVPMNAQFAILSGIATPRSTLLLKSEVAVLRAHADDGRGCLVHRGGDG